MSNKYIKRVGKSTESITKGKVYMLNGLSIFDDKGNAMRPYFDKETHWIRCDSFGSPLFKGISADTIIMDDITERDPANWYLPPPDEWLHYLQHNLSSKLTQTKEDNTMIDIKATTLINGKDSDDLPIDNLIRLIAEQETLIDNLNKIRTPSKAIDTLKAKHESTITDLVQILDNRKDV